MTIFFSVVLAYVAVTSVLIWRRRTAGPRFAVRLALVLGITMLAFPSIRSALSSDGRGIFALNAATMSWEWALILMALGPIHVVCIYAVLGNKLTEPARKSV